MAEKEFYRLDLVISTDGVEDAEKQVKAIDKMLEQTTRRASVLGKTKITPTARLEDRISSPAQKIEGRMEKINRTVAKPEARLVDKVSGATNKISSTLTSLARKPYTVFIYAKDMATGIISKIMNVLSSPLTLLGVGGGLAGVTTVGLNMVMEEQGIRSQFKVLLGSEDAAQKRVDELTAFAGQTPYKREEIYEASRILQVFTGNALSTGNELKRIGDIAAGTKQPFGDVALWMGRLYDAMKSGRPVGEMTSRLQEMGAINGEARAGIEALAESGMDISKTWPIVTQAFDKFDGMMEEMSGNLQNLLLGTKSFVTQNVFKRWGMGIESVLGPALKKFRQWRSENKETIAILGQSVEDFGKKIGTFVIGGIDKVTTKFNELVKNPEFQNADFLGKVRIAWDEIIAKPFSEWWASNGEAVVTDMSSKIGGALGGGLKGFIMGALGLFTSGDTLGDDGTFTEAGVTAGQAFFQSFIDAFDVLAIAEKLTDTAWEVGVNAFTDPSAGNLLAAGFFGTLLYKFGGGKFVKWLWDKTVNKGSKIPSPTGGTPKSPAPKASPSSPNKPLQRAPGPYQRGWQPRTPTTHPPVAPKSPAVPGKVPKVIEYVAKSLMPVGVATLPITIPGAGYLISENLKNERIKRSIEWQEKYKDDPKMLEWGALPTSERYMSFAANSPKTTTSKQDFVFGVPSDTVKISEDQVSQMMSYLQDFKKEVTNDIRVTLPPGAVQINMPTQEMDLKQIAYEAGWKIADAVRQAQQNKK
ncbi:hypothetical protein [Paenibacillus thiaminolyticus]|uniref:hypothetical protein n=1 Tax=Paenibacillus thiaminolyticus TaxID=49283 RepID=UPI000E6C9206|nr:hypothetical protein [Paenibacillus thiaminolyticus]